jgi:hypothetical protein
VAASLFAGAGTDSNLKRDSLTLCSIRTLTSAMETRARENIEVPAMKKRRVFMG